MPHPWSDLPSFPLSTVHTLVLSAPPFPTQSSEVWFHPNNCMCPIRYVSRGSKSIVCQSRSLIKTSPLYRALSGLAFFKLPSMRTKYHIFSPTCTCKISLIASVIYFGQIYCFIAPCSPKLISNFDIYIYDLHLINEVFSIRKSGIFSVYQSKANFEFYQQQVNTFYYIWKR